MPRFATDLVLDPIGIAAGARSPLRHAQDANEIDAGCRRHPVPQTHGGHCMKRSLVLFSLFVPSLALAHPGHEHVLGSSVHFPLELGVAAALAAAGIAWWLGTGSENQDSL